MVCTGSRGAGFRSDGRSHSQFICIHGLCMCTLTEQNIRVNKVRVCSCVLGFRGKNVPFTCVTANVHVHSWIALLKASKDMVFNCFAHSFNQAEW